MPKRLETNDVLKLDSGYEQGTVRRHFMRWRVANGKPKERCDNEACVFFRAPLEWNGKRLKMVLDHAEGNCDDNHFSVLRFLCPNCDSQLIKTRGGANVGRVTDRITGLGYTLQHPDGRTIHAATGLTNAAASKAAAVAAAKKSARSSSRRSKRRR